MKCFEKEPQKDTEVVYVSVLWETQKLKMQSMFEQDHLVDKACFFWKWAWPI